MNTKDNSFKILITGAKGFIGRNLIDKLMALNYYTIYEYDLDNSFDDLENFCKDCEFVFNLAGVHRPQNPMDFYVGNTDIGAKIIEYLLKYNNKCPILLSSSIQAELDNDYGKSKKMAEELFYNYAKCNNVDVYVFRLENIFGKWARPNSHSVIATFCYNISHDLPIRVNDRNTVMSLVYIDDVIETFIKCLHGDYVRSDRFCKVLPVYTAQLGCIADTISGFRRLHDNISINNMDCDLIKKLYVTYLRYAEDK